MKYRQIIISLVIGLILGLSTNAFAAVGTTAQAVYAQFNYVVNGVNQPPGVTALVYDGISYLRTTDLGNMLGFDVTYKADTRTIEFNKPTTPMPSPTPAASLTPTVTSVTYAATPDPVTGITPTPDPNATLAPSATPSPTPAPTAVPVDVPGGGDRTTYCRSLPSDSMAYLIAGCNN